MDQGRRAATITQAMIAAARLMRRATNHSGDIWRRPTRVPRKELLQSSTNNSGAARSRADLPAYGSWWGNVALGVGWRSDGTQVGWVTPGLRPHQDRSNEPR